MDRELLAILVCPVSKAPLVPSADGTELLCAASGLAFPVRDGIPVLLAGEARELDAGELDRLRDGRPLPPGGAS
ncbi:MAG: Trm112 family protein [Pseudomonadales bacterium]|nr:Trm112 family protein [Pseudomonadales bacterium]